MHILLNSECEVLIGWSETTPPMGSTCNPVSKADNQKSKIKNRKYIHAC